MSTVVEGLVLAVRALPKVDKVKFIGYLLEDIDVREAMAELFIDMLVPVGNQKDEHRRRRGNGPSGTSNEHESTKERAKRLRESYVSELQKNGIRINQVDTVWAKVGDLWVAIPTATEGSSGHWFLGLAGDKVRERIKEGGVAVVLLCQSASGSRLDLVIPAHIVEEIIPKLSKDSYGQIKFNVKKVGNRYQLVLPRSSPLDVSGYKGEVSIFQS